MIKIIGNKMKTHQSKLLIALWACALSAGPALAQSSVYFDAFTGGSDGALNEQAPQVRPDDETWAAGSATKDTEEGIVTINGDMSANLPMPEFDPERTYTLTARVVNNHPESANQWIAIGWNSQTGSARYNNAGVGTYWMLWRGNNEVRALRGPGATNFLDAGDTTATGVDNVLDLRVVIDMPEDTASFLYKDPDASEWSMLTSTPLSESIINGIQGVGFSAFQPDGNVAIKSFELATDGDPPVEVSPPSFFITRNTDTPGTYDFEWESESGKLYDLLSSTDLATPVSEWPVYDDGETVHEGIVPAGEVTVLEGVPSPDPRRFFALSIYDAPPPPPLFFTDFEDDDGGFTVVTAGAGSTWEYGEPDAEIEDVIAIVGGNDGSANAWGVNLTGNYATDTDTSLRSPPIDLSGLDEGSGVRLGFALAVDTADDASLVVRLIEEDGDTVVGGEVWSLTGEASAEWEEIGPIDLPEEAIGEVVRIEWHFTGPTDSIGYLGAYIDDVVVTVE